MEEIVELADRSISVFNGSINAEFTREETIMDNLTAATFGLESKKEAAQ